MKSLILMSAVLVSTTALQADHGSARLSTIQTREIFVDSNNIPELMVDGGLREGEVALTFDDGPHPPITRKILKVLKKYGVKAVFFQVGRNAENAQEITQEILAEGHSLGSHSWDHTELSKLPLNEAIANIRRGHAAVEQAAAPGFHTPFFRFPYGNSTPELVQSIQNLGYVPIHFNIVSGDHEIFDPNKLLANSLAALDSEKKGVFLFHDIQPQTAEMLDSFLSELFKRSYKTVVFRPHTLKSLAEKRGIRIGSSLFWPKDHSDSRSKNVALREFNVFTMPAYFRLNQPQQNKFDFSGSDQTVDFAPPGTVVRGHTLIWCELIPDWLKNGNFTGAQLREILVNHVMTVIGHYRKKYPGRVIAWDVVNEVFSWKGDKCIWNRIGLEAGLGELEYVKIALRAARQADPKAKLYVNDFLIEGMNEKSNSMYHLVLSLLKEGVPVDGVGFQSHYVVQSSELFGPLPPVEEIIQNLNRFAALGLETSITEADFSIKDSEVSESTLGAQAEEYRKLVGACLRSKGCKAFVTWGVGDRDSWIPQASPGWGTPLLFDSNYGPKPAYNAIKEELAKFYR